LTGADEGRNFENGAVLVQFETASEYLFAIKPTSCSSSSRQLSTNLYGIYHCWVHSE